MVAVRLKNTFWLVAYLEVVMDILSAFGLAWIVRGVFKLFLAFIKLPFLFLFFPFKVLGAVFGGGDQYVVVKKKK